MTIDIDCQCGRSIEYDESEWLYNEDYIPHEIACPCCGVIFELGVHMTFIKKGDPNKKFSRNDPDYNMEVSDE